MEQETLKLREKEDDHTSEVKRWKENLRPRKKVIIAAIVSLVFIDSNIESFVCMWMDKGQQYESLDTVLATSAHGYNTIEFIENEMKQVD